MKATQPCTACKAPWSAERRTPLSSSDDTPLEGAVASEPPGQGLASSAEDVRARRSTTARVQSIASITDNIQHYLGRLAYRYFNWRQDTWNDLQLFATFNTVLLLIATLLKTNVVDVLDHEADQSTSSAQHFWQSLYEALTVVFGQDLPDNTANVLQQLWSLMVAAIGLAAFALVLALVEQVVLEVLKNNVQRGSQVYEEGHVSHHMKLVDMSEAKSHLFHGALSSKTPHTAEQKHARGVSHHIQHN